MNKLLSEKTRGSADSKDLAAPAAVSSAEEPKVSSYSGETNPTIHNADQVEKLPFFRQLPLGTFLKKKL